MRTNGALQKVRLLNGHVSDDGWPSVIATQLCYIGLTYELHKNLN